MIILKHKHTQCDGERMKKQTHIGNHYARGYSGVQRDVHIRNY